MKTILTPEKSQRLIDLGVDPKMATYSDVVADESGNHYVEKLIFSLADLLSILPKEIDGYKLNISTTNQLYFVSYISWGYIECFGSYIRDARPDAQFYSSELIEALYSLLIWCLEQKKIIKLNEGV